MKNNDTENFLIKSSYIHIPFCKKKCGYCSFLSYETLELKSIYVDTLLKEIKKSYDNTPQKTLYIGGGTPSLLGLGDFEEIFACFNLDSDAEITVEINPCEIRREYLEGLRSLGVNRLSIGVQSFDDEILKTIGRNHNFSDIKNTLNLARQAGFENISTDLIYGLPNQDLKNWEKTLKTALDFEPAHISLYGLKIDKGCYFYKNRPRNLANEDLQADMYLSAVDILSNFCHYEISNFAKNKAFMGRHNLNYWHLGFYNGFGAGASGFMPFTTNAGFQSLQKGEGGRYTNVKNLEKYIMNPFEKTYEKTNTQSLLEEKIFLGFRLLGENGGLDTQKINQKYGIDFEKKYETQLNKFMQTGHIIKKENNYKLSTEGVLLSNLILCEFI